MSTQCSMTIRLAPGMVTHAALRDGGPRDLQRLGDHVQVGSVGVVVVVRNADGAMGVRELGACVTVGGE